MRGEDGGFRFAAGVAGRPGEASVRRGPPRGLKCASFYFTLLLMMVPILLKTVFTVLLSPGIQATAATATKPAASAYSTRSCP